MLTKTRSDFWKCACGGKLLTPDQYCRACLSKMDAHGRPATNVEVLIAWLSADDERRKEIEIASRPSEHGKYFIYFFDGVNGLPVHAPVNYHGWDHGDRGRHLWIPIGEPIE